MRNRWYDTIGSTIRNHPSIFICAINGLCVGAGVTLINISDLAIMADDAEIAIPQINFNIYPGVAGASSQTRLLKKHAAWLILNGNRINAEQALEMGFVNQVVPPDRLMEEAMALAEHVAQFNPIALDWCKKALDPDPEPDIRLEQRAQLRAHGDEHYSEPDWQGQGEPRGLRRIQAGLTSRKVYR